MSNGTTRGSVLSLPIDVISYSTAVAQILHWAMYRESRYICAANVHMFMEAQDDPRLAECIQRADLVTADGMPLVWALRAQGFRRATRVYGPDLMLLLCEAAARLQIPVGLFGSTPAVMSDLRHRLVERFPSLRIPYSFSPPQRVAGAPEEGSTLQALAASGAALLFVGLGCPKQELWMASQRGRLDLVMVGVGAAFDFHSGHVRQAPRLLQRFGLEWAFRLSQEPKRLAGRYLRHNPEFLYRWLSSRCHSGR